MKKLAWMVSALALTAAAYAEPTLTTSAYVDSGLKVVSTADGTTFQNYANDWGDSGVRATLGAAYTGDKAGFTVTIDIASDDGVSTDTAYGWVKPLEGLTLFAGTSYDGTFAAVDDQGNDYFSSKGLSAAYSISGFSLGAGVIPAVTADDTVSAVFGAGYALDKLISLRVNALTAADELDKLSVSISSAAIEGLSLSAGYLAEGLATDTTQWIDAAASYQVTPALSASLAVYDYLTAEYYSFIPSVTYQATEALSLTGKVTVTTEGKSTDATVVPYVKAAYAVDGASTIWTSAQYDSASKTTTLALDYVFSF